MPASAGQAGVMESSRNPVKNGCRPHQIDPDYTPNLFGRFKSFWRLKLGRQKSWKLRLTFLTATTIQRCARRKTSTCLLRRSLARSLCPRLRVPPRLPTHVSGRHLSLVCILVYFSVPVFVFVPTFSSQKTSLPCNVDHLPVLSLTPPPTHYGRQG